MGKDLICPLYDFLKLLVFEEQEVLLQDKQGSYHICYFNCPTVKCTKTLDVNKKNKLHKLIFLGHKWASVNALQCSL